MVHRLICWTLKMGFICDFKILTIRVHRSLSVSSPSRRLTLQIPMVFDYVLIFWNVAGILSLLLLLELPASFCSGSLLYVPLLLWGFRDLQDKCRVPKSFTNHPLFPSRQAWLCNGEETGGKTIRGRWNAMGNREGLAWLWLLWEK